ncbi:mediator of RNA polymerase II transcription subunit 28 [Canna indica]|uniref:Mediator of RNA polymerase II transcription subunit 28 n=1 Tax=Canna indica TaxID=4628 RepID=A0AAQ3KXA4_9LILI|nr:mediator of RNA polymerase II transcription subunit 28 [Canna indica]
MAEDQQQQQGPPPSEPESGEQASPQVAVPSTSPMAAEERPAQLESPHQTEDLMACVAALDAALLPCLPARELQAVDRSVHSAGQSDVARHAKEFMEVAKKLQWYFIGLQHKDKPSREEILRKEISIMEEELKAKSELIKKHERLIEGWRKELNEQLETHVTELERV